MENSQHIGFDNDKYLQEQSAAILERVSRFNDKLYLECGGKILYDYHAARVLPGFDQNVKMRLLQKLKDKIDVTAFYLWFIENYPESAQGMRSNPDYQYRFK